MNIVVPIVLFAVALGLFVKRMTPRLWALMICWILFITVHYYLKH